MDTADNLRDANPWRAEQDPVKLAILGKLSEELGELQASVGRCIIQGVDGVHPVTGKPNIEWLEEEMIDVKNMMRFCVGFVLGIADLKMTREQEKRLHKKRDHIEQWLASF